MSDEENEFIEVICVSDNDTPHRPKSPGNDKRDVVNVPLHRESSRQWGFLFHTAADVLSPITIPAGRILPAASTTSRRINLDLGMNGSLVTGESQDDIDSSEDSSNEVQIVKVISRAKKKTTSDGSFFPGS